jgi:hypothetical protein
MLPSAWEFQNRLMAILNGARENGKGYVDVESGNLHRQVAGDPNSNQRMPVCWDVMRRMMRAGDSVIEEPTAGQGTKLIIRYILQATARPQHKIELDRKSKIPG